PNAADAPAPRRLGAPTPATDRSPAPGCRVSNPVRGLGARKTAFCCASPSVPLAEPLPQTDPSAIRSTASEVVVTTAYRHRVTLEALRPGIPEQYAKPFKNVEYAETLFTWAEVANLESDIDSSSDDNEDEDWEEGDEDG